MRDYGAAETLLDQDTVAECHLIELEFSSGTSRYNTTGWEFPWNSVTWFAGNDMFGLSFGAEDTTLESYKATVTLSAMNPAMLGRALSERVRGRRGTIYHCIFNPDTFDIVEVTREWSGWLSGVTIVSGDGNA